MRTPTTHREEYLPYYLYICLSVVMASFVAVNHRLRQHPKIIEEFTVHHTLHQNQPLPIKLIHNDPSQSLQFTILEVSTYTKTSPLSHKNIRYSLKNETHLYLTLIWAHSLLDYLNFPHPFSSQKELLYLPFSIIYYTLVLTRLKTIFSSTPPAMNLLPSPLPFSLKWNST